MLDAVDDAGRGIAIDGSAGEIVQGKKGGQFGVYLSGRFAIRRRV
jgi:hypothetical protein